MHINTTHKIITPRPARKRRAGLARLNRPESMRDAQDIAAQLRLDGVPDAAIARAIAPYRLADIDLRQPINFPLITKGTTPRPHLLKTVTLAKASVDGRIVRGVISSDAVDRVGDVLIPGGAQTQNFRANPLVYNSHRYDELPVGKCIGLDIGTTEIVARTMFAERPATHPASEEWMPDTLLHLYKTGFLKGWSVGLNVIEARPPTKADRTKWPGVSRVINKWELVEYSVAPIPMNPTALSRSNTSTAPHRVRIVLPK